MGRAKTAEHKQGVSREELRERHDATVAKRERMRDQRADAKVALIYAADDATTKYKANPTKKNYRNFKTAMRRGSDQNLLR